MKIQLIKWCFFTKNEVLVKKMKQLPNLGQLGKTILIYILLNALK
jgi:hypothetical protein